MGSWRVKAPPLITEVVGKITNTTKTHQADHWLSHRCLSQQDILLTFRFCFGARPARKHECNLVDEICNVVEHVEEDLINGSEQVAEKVAKGVDGPTRRDDHAHVLKGSRDGLAAARSG